jgi:hypothetical protein
VDKSSEPISMPAEPIHRRPPRVWRAAVVAPRHRPIWPRRACVRRHRPPRDGRRSSRPRLLPGRGREHHQCVCVTAALATAHEREWKEGESRMPLHVRGWRERGGPPSGRGVVIYHCHLTTTDFRKLSVKYCLSTLSKLNDISKRRV